MDMLLQIIEADWTERLRMQHEHTGEADLGSPNTFLKDSLIVQYIGGSSSTGHGGLRRVLRAIFAEGTQRDLTEFSEVWPGERKKRKAKPAKVNTKGMNIEEGEFGDYFDSDSDSMDESDGVQIKQENEAKGKRSGSRISTGSAKKWGTRVEDEAEFIQDDSGPCEAYGGHGALMLRKRILILLTKVASALPDHFVTHNTLLDTLEESTRLLPLPVSAALFTHIQASPATSSPRFTPSTHISMLQEFTRPLLAGSGGSKSKSYFLTQQKLEDEYLPFASGSGSSAVAGGSGDVVADNAKLSLCLEAMLRLLHAETKLDSSNGRLRKAVEKGMKARRSVVDAGGGDQSKKRKVDGDDGVNQALQTFNACQARMKVLLIMIERSGND